MEGRVVLAQPTRWRGLSLALDVEGPRDHLLLPLGKFAGVVPTAAASPAAGLLRLPVRLIERADAQEVDVGLRLLPVAAVVARAGVVRDEVTRLQLQLLEEERVPGADLAQALAARVQRDRLFRPTVHGVHEIDVRHAVIVARLHLREHFLDRRDLHVTPWLLERDRRRAIVENVDRIVERSRNEFALGRLQLELVEPVLSHLNRPAQCAVGIDRQDRWLLAFDQ